MPGSSLRGPEIAKDHILCHRSTSDNPKTPGGLSHLIREPSCFGIEGYGVFPVGPPSASSGPREY